MAELRDVTCHMGSHGFTTVGFTHHPTQVNAPALTPASKLVFDLPTPEGWKADLTQATRRCTSRESNSRSLDHKSSALTTTPPSNPQTVFMAHSVYYVSIVYLCTGSQFLVLRGLTAVFGSENMQYGDEKLMQTKEHRGTFFTTCARPLQSGPKSDTPVLILQ